MYNPHIHYSSYVSISVVFSKHKRETTDKDDRQAELNIFDLCRLTKTSVLCTVGHKNMLCIFHCNSVQSGPILIITKKELEK